jgi:hypothetical protein
VLQRWQGLSGGKAVLEGTEKTFDEVKAERQS